MKDHVQDSVKEYYGKILQNSGDLKTNACCTDVDLPNYLKAAMANVHGEVSARYYGCGLVSPQQLQGTRILDLGSGSGKDCYVLAQLVGEDGYVLGIDMTEEQLQVANRHLDYHANKFGYGRSNVEFRQGYIERLDELDLPDSHFDIIVSNCVINLSPDKRSVLEQAYRLLKTGGELYFSDVYADRRVPQELVDDPVLYGECLSGALYWNDFQNLAKQAGFIDPRLVLDRPLEISNPEIKKRIGHVNFYSVTHRLFKLPDLEPECEDYGQAVVYKGTVSNCESAFELDKHHRIETGKIFPVCGNTYRMLNETRFREHFEFYGNWDNHYGIFDGCGVSIPYNESQAQKDVSSSSGACC